MAAKRTKLKGSDRREVIEQAATELFAERGYRGASMEEIARRSGVTPPVLYDHFRSKADLHRRLIERHYAELRRIWLTHDAVELPQAVEAWFAYVEAHPYAGRMLFRDTTGDPHIEAAHREIRAQSRAALLPLVPARRRVDAELAWEVLRSVLQGLALWWYEHPEVPRATVVGAALDGIWTGYERRLATGGTGR